MRERVGRLQRGGKRERERRRERQPDRQTRESYSKIRRNVCVIGSNFQLGFRQRYPRSISVSRNMSV